MSINWKTTAGGAAFFVGYCLTMIPEPAWVSSLGHALIAIGGSLGFAMARDYDKSSEESKG